MNTLVETNMKSEYPETPLMRIERMRIETEKEAEDTIYLKSSGEYYNIKYKKYHNDAQIRKMLSIALGR
jgi:hypothetical protein